LSERASAVYFWLSDLHAVITSSGHHDVRIYHRTQTSHLGVLGIHHHPEPPGTLVASSFLILLVGFTQRFLFLRARKDTNGDGPYRKIPFSLLSIIFGMVKKRGSHHRLKNCYRRFQRFPSRTMSHPCIIMIYFWDL
jgi:hypothetical protein